MIMRSCHVHVQIQNSAGLESKRHNSFCKLLTDGRLKGEFCIHTSQFLAILICCFCIPTVVSLQRQTNETEIILSNCLIIQKSTIYSLYFFLLFPRVPSSQHALSLVTDLACGTFDINKLPMLNQSKEFGFSKSISFLVDLNVLHHLTKPHQ